MFKFEGGSAEIIHAFYKLLFIATDFFLTTYDVKFGCYGATRSPLLPRPRKFIICSVHSPFTSTIEKFRYCIISTRHNQSTVSKAEPFIHISPQRHG